MFSALYPASLQILCKCKVDKLYNLQTNPLILLKVRGILLAFQMHYTHEEEYVQAIYAYKGLKVGSCPIWLT